MKKKTVVIVVLTLVLALLAVAVIATFPTYLFEDVSDSSTSTPIQSDSIVEGESEQGDDVGVLNNDSTSGTQAVLPEIDDDAVGLPEISDKNLITIAETKSVKVLAEVGAFEDGTKITITKLGILNKAYYRARHCLRGISKSFTAYDFSAKKNNKEVAPNALTKIIFDIPEGYNPANTAIYYLLSDGGVQELNYTISDDNKTVWTKASQTGVYILVEKDTKPESNISSDITSTESDNTDSEVSSSTPEDTSNDTSSDVSSDSSSDSSSDASSEDATKDTMDGWTPWY